MSEAVPVGKLAHELKMVKRWMSAEEETLKGRKKGWQRLEMNEMKKGWSRMI